MNKVLQDLIHSYKELQTLYNSEETFDKDKFSDSEYKHITKKDAHVSEHIKDAVRVTPKNFPVTNFGMDYFNSGEENNNNNKMPKLRKVKKTKEHRVTPQVLAFQLHGNVRDVHVDTKIADLADVSKPQISKEEKKNSNGMTIKTGNLMNQNYINDKRKINDTLAMLENYASSEDESNQENADDEDEVLRSHTYKPIQNGKSYTKDKIWVKIPSELKNSTEVNNKFEIYEDNLEDDDLSESVNDDEEVSMAILL